MADIQKLVTAQERKPLELRDRGGKPETEITEFQHLNQFVEHEVRINNGCKNHNGKHDTHAVPKYHPADYRLQTTHEGIQATVLLG